MHLSAEETEPFNDEFVKKCTLTNILKWYDIVACVQIQLLKLKEL